MVDIEPYKQIKKTNIQEHNDMVDKINEIVNVINNAELEGIGSRLDTIDSTDALQWKDIESIKAKDTEQDDKLADNTKVLAGVIDSSVSDVAIMNGTTTGNIKVRIGRENAPSIDSDDYNIQKPTSVELVQGSAPAMVKAQITLSDGTVLVSDDFMFTTESIGQDVYISSFVFKNGNVAGTISADIGLSNGTTLEANNFAVPTDPSVVNSITDLQSRMTAVESADVGELATLKTTVAEHTVAITTLDNDVADMMISKADVDNVNQVIVAKQIDLESIVRINSQNRDTKFGIIANNTNYPFNVTEEVEAFGQLVDKPIGSIAMLDVNGNPMNFTAGGGGEVWEEVDLNNWPTDWVDGDRIKLSTNLVCTPNNTIKSTSGWIDIVEYIVRNNGSHEKICSISHTASKDIFYGLYISSYTNFNTSTIFKLTYSATGEASKSANVTVNSISTYASDIKIWRLKK